MAKSVTVTFDDGTSHTYDNVPDEVTDDQVTQRASGEFGDKTVTGVVGGVAPVSAPEATPGAGPVAPLSTTDKIAAGVATAANLAMEHPGVAAGAAGLWKANKVANAYIKSKAEEVAASQARTAQQAETAAQNAALQRERMAERMARPTANAVAEAPKQPMGFVDTNAPRMGPTPGAAPSPMPQGMATPAQGMANLPGAGAGPTPAAPEAPPTASNYMARMTQLADRYLPAKAVQAIGTAGRAIAPVARVLSSAPAMGAQLMLHSPGLNANEDEELRRRRQMQPTFNFPQQ